MKKITFLLLILFVAIVGLAQVNLPAGYDGYYYYDGKPQYWKTDSTSANIIVKNLENLDSIVNRLHIIFNGEKDSILITEIQDIFIFSDTLRFLNKDTIISFISIDADDIAFFTYSKKTIEGTIWLRNEILVKYKRDSLMPIDTLQILLSDYDLLSITFDTAYNEYSIICKNELDVMNIANVLYDIDIVKYSTPDFYGEIELHTSDTYWNEQWNLNQNGQGGYYDNDINAPEAWDFINSLGVSLGGEIKVAVVDDGVDWHEDMGDRVLDGYTAGGGGGAGHCIADCKHGQCCAGIIVAQHNNIGVAGIAPNAKIVPIRIFKNSNGKTFAFPNSSIRNAIHAAWADLDAKILSCSWGFPNCNSLIPNEIENALNNNRIVVFSSGNGQDEFGDIGPGTDFIPRPQNVHSKVIVVGASRSDGKRGTTSNYGTELDVVAPGYNINTTDRMGNNGYNSSNYISNFNATSAACPHVSGVAALMLSVNPNLTTEDVQTIICQTAKKVGGYTYSNHSSYPYGTHNQEVGYGMVDAYEAVKKAYQVRVTGNDLLYMKDNPNDFGVTGHTGATDNSPDIWVRKSYVYNDGIEHKYDDPAAFNNTVGQTIYVYVRVRNKGSYTTDGTGQIKLYWGIRGGNTAWPNSWNGTYPDFGNIIGSQNIGFIPSGQEKIFRFSWVITNSFSDDWQKCLLARIENCVVDPTETFSNQNIGYHVRNSNNITLHNCSFINVTPNTSFNSCGGYMYIGNFTDEPLTSNLVFTESYFEDLKGLINECVVTATFDSIGWQALSSYFIDNDNFSIIKPGKVRILSDSARIDNIVYPANTYYPMLTEYSFIASKKSKQANFLYEIFETIIDSTGFESYAGSHVYIDKTGSISFKAITDKSLRVNLGNPITLNATLQSYSNLDYNWYDNDGNLIGNGTSVTVYPTVNTDYLLSVEATDLCFNDYANISVTVNQNFINSVTPNPATNTITVDYHLSSTIRNASIKITNQLGTIGYTYNISSGSTSYTTTVSGLSIGAYTVSLVCDDKVVDSKNFVKQ